MTPLTATFPSATASALVTLNTGRTPADHGLVAGNCWLPDRQVVLESLPFDPGPRACERCGDVVYLPREGSVWHEPLAHRSLHGGLSPREMLVPFAAARLSEV